MVGIGEIRKKRVEVGVEIRKFSKWREGLADAIAPPMPLEAPKLIGPKPVAEGKAGSFTESTAKTGGDGVLRGVEAELPRETGVAASNRLARLEQSAGGVEEYGADQEMRNRHGVSSFTGGGGGASAPGLRRAHQKMSHSAPHAAR